MAPRTSGSRSMRSSTCDAPGFGERLDPVRAVHEVVERPEEQHGVPAAIGLAKLPRVAENGLDSLGTRGVHVPRHRIDELHAVAFAGESGRVDPGSTAHVKDTGVRRQAAT